MAKAAVCIVDNQPLLVGITTTYRATKYPQKKFITIYILGGRTRARTWDPLIKSQLLYQLSYAPGLPSAGNPAGAVRLAKASRSVQPR